MFLNLTPTPKIAPKGPKNNSHKRPKKWKGGGKCGQI